jgi:hypothetical protein
MKSDILFRVQEQLELVQKDSAVKTWAILSELYDDAYELGRLSEAPRPLPEDFGDDDWTLRPDVVQAVAEGVLAEMEGTTAWDRAHDVYMLDWAARLSTSPTPTKPPTLDEFLAMAVTDCIEGR